MVDVREAYRRAERERLQQRWEAWCFTIAGCIAGSAIVYLIWG